MLPKDSDALNDSQNHSEEIEVLAGIADTFKLDAKKAPAVNEQVAKIVRGFMREKLSEDVLTDTQYRYKRPENCDCLETTKINHLFWDKLKPETRSADIKLHRIQGNLIKGVIPLVSIIQELVQARDKVPKDALDISQMVKMTTDATALIGAANFQLNMRRREQIKPELTTKICVQAQCHLLIPCLATTLTFQISSKTTKVSRKIRRVLKAMLAKHMVTRATEI